MDSERWKRLAVELENLLDCDPDKCKQRLVELEASDPDLAVHLRDALDADTHHFTLLDQPLSLQLDVPDDSEDVALMGAQVGDCIGPWRLQHELGCGGMGRVWLATRADGEYHLEVAIKLIDGVPDSNLVREQLRRERQILADLDHPNIARLLDGGVRSDGTPWYAMEYVKGQALDDYCAQHDIPVRDRLRLLVDIARAVHHAHTRLVVHRDLKPGNILVDETGSAHLLDFGIAKLLDSGAASSSGPLTLMGAATPAYAAPEQLRGEQVGTAADIYALGVIAHELLCGIRPQDATTAMDSREGGPLPSRVTTDRQRRAVLRGDIDAIVSKSLASEPDSRYVSAEAFASDIERYLINQPVAARQASRAYRLRKFTSRHWLGVALGSTAVLVLCAALAFSIMQTRRAQVELARANAVQGFLLGVFDATQPAIGSSLVMTQRDLADRAIDLLDKQLAGQPDAAVDVLIAVGRVYRKLGFAKRSRAVLQRALLRLDETSQVKDDPRRVSALLALGRADLLAGDFQKARDHFVQADRLSTGSGANLHTHTIILKELGTTQSAMRQIPMALKSLKRAEALARRDRNASVLLPKILIERALALRRAHRMDDAIVEGRNALSAARRTYGEKDVRTAGAYSTVGAMLRRAGQPAEAETMLRKAVAIEKQAYGQPQAASVNNLASVLQDRGQLVESGVLFRRALELAGQRYGVDSIATSSYRRNLALEQADAGQIDAALANMRKAYARFADGNPLGGPSNLEMRAQLARLLYQAGNQDEAAALLPEILTDAPKHPETAIIPLHQAHMLSARLALDAHHLDVAGRQLVAARAGLKPLDLETTDRVRLKLLAGDIAHAAHQPRKALAEWRAALQLAENKLGPRHTLARAATQRLRVLAQR